MLPQYLYPNAHTHLGVYSWACPFPLPCSLKWESKQGTPPFHRAVAFACQDQSRDPPPAPPPAATAAWTRGSSRSSRAEGGPCSTALGMTAGAVTCVTH